MAKVISEERLSKHTTEKYNFKVFSMGADSEVAKSVFDKNSQSKELNLEAEQNIDVNLPEPLVTGDVDSSALNTSSKDSLIESLLKKTDEMSSNFIKLQMKLEDMSEQHKSELVKEKEASFNEGIQEGISQAKLSSDKSMEDGISQFSSSVSTLEASAAEFEVALEGIKSHLVDAALDISQEVIKIELSENSTEVATLLSNELIKELQNASKVTIKVNPKDHGGVSSSVGSLKHVEVLSDSAVSAGGVVVLSDAGNIDAQISKRFERVKRAALSE